MLKNYGFILNAFRHLFFCYKLVILALLLTPVTQFVTLPLHEYQVPFVRFLMLNSVCRSLACYCESVPFVFYKSIFIYL